MQADMLELPFDDDCFDLVIEKGTMVTFNGILANNYEL